MTDPRITRALERLEAVGDEFVYIPIVQPGRQPAREATNTGQWVDLSKPLAAVDEIEGGGR